MQIDFHDADVIRRHCAMPLDVRQRAAELVTNALFEHPEIYLSVEAWYGLRMLGHEAILSLAAATGQQVAELPEREVFLAILRLSAEPCPVPAPERLRQGLGVIRQKVGAL